MGNSNTEEKILAAAVMEFEENGYDGCRMQRIADRAGINKALLHYYYRSKEKLFSKVFKLVAKNLFGRILNLLAGDISIEEKIRVFYEEHFKILEKYPRLPVFLINEISRNPNLVDEFISSIPEFENIKNKISEQYLEGVKSGKFQEYDLIQLCLTIVSMSVFPFAIKEIVEKIGLSKKLSFKDIIEQRKRMAPEFIINSIVKKEK